jgi:hypothetical protein
MRFATFEKNGGLALGISAGTRFLDISAAWTDNSIPAPANMQHIIESHDLYVPVVEKLTVKIPVDSPCIPAGHRHVLEIGNLGRLANRMMVNR